MIISKRKYYCDYFLCMMVVGVLIFMSAPIANKYLWHIRIINDVCRYSIIMEAIIIITVIIISLLKNGGIKNFINVMHIRSAIESNLISVGAYKKQENKVYVELPKIKIKSNTIIISLKDLRIRTIISRYLDSFSTALPERYEYSGAAKPPFRRNGNHLSGGRKPQLLLMRRSRLSGVA